MNKKQLFTLVAAIAAIPIFSSTNAAADDPCADVPVLEEQVKKLFAEYGTLDNRQGQSRKPIVKQQIIDTQAKLDAAKKACASKPTPASTPTPGPSCKVYNGEGCYWMQSQAPYCWVPSPMTAPDAAACKRLDSCSPDGGKASGGGCYKWAKSSDAAPPGSGPTPGDRCSPQIGNNSMAAGVCGPVCEKQGLVFAGNWSNDVNHPPVKACIDKKEGQAVCGCGIKKETAKVPGEASGQTLKLACAGKTISVVEASYGKNCKGELGGNMTKRLKEACDGKASCDYKVDHTVIGDPAFGCRKDYVADFECR